MARQGRAVHLLEGMEQVFGRHLLLPIEGAPLVLATWSMGSYLYERFDIYPPLFIYSPVESCGKSTLLKILKTGCNRAQKLDHCSEADLFHRIDEEKPTLLLDEQKARQLRREVMLSVLDSGYERDGAISRVVAGAPRVYHTYCPKALAMRGLEVDSQLYSRLILFKMAKATPGTLPRFQASDYAELAKDIGEWGEDERTQSDAYIAYQKIAREFGQDLAQMLDDDREAQLWIPLLATLYVTDRSRLTELRDIAQTFVMEKNRRKKPQENLEVLLAGFPFVDKFPHEKIPTQEILAYLHQHPTGNFDELSEKKLAQLLRDFDVVPRRMRFSNNVTARGYSRNDWRKAVTHYGGSKIKVN